MAYTQEFLRITKEATFGTYDDAADPADVAIVQLDQANAFSMRPSPMRWSIRTHGSNNRRAQTGSSKTQLAGSLQTLLYPSQAALLLPWGCNLDGTTGQAFSCTIDHAITMEDATPTVVYRRYLGVKVGSLNLTGDSDGQLVRLKLDLVGKQPAAITGTDFGTPALSDYPSGAPYVFQHAASGLTLDGSVTEFKSLDLTIKNILDATFNASQYVTRLKNCGRDVDLKTSLVYQRTTDRTKFEGVTPITIAVVLTNGANSITFDLNTNSYYASVQDDLPLDKVKYQALSLESYVDGTDGDFSVTVV